MECKYENKDKKCHRPASENGYCGRHQTLGYLREQLEKDGTKKVCCNFERGCRNVLDINYEFAKCEECRNKNKIPCKNENCKYKASENGYCKLHQKFFIKEQIEDNGQKVCSNFSRGCTNALDLDSKFTPLKI
jgi:hypothetical protein